METIHMYKVSKYVPRARDLPMRDGNEGISVRSKRRGVKARDLPMRDGNLFLQWILQTAHPGPRSSYEGWKRDNYRAVLPPARVARDLPMRDGNNDTNEILRRKPVGPRSSYEGWKHLFSVLGKFGERLPAIFL